MIKQLKSLSFCKLTQLSSILLISLFLSVKPVLAEDGRYRAIVMHEGGRLGQSGNFFPKIFIIDSSDGHIWTWEQKTKLQGTNADFALGTVLTYQGRVKPGKKMGDIVEQSIDR